MAKRNMVFGLVLTLGLFVSSCTTMYQNLERKVDQNELYKTTEKSVQEDIRGDIVTESFILVYSGGGVQQMLIQKITQNNNVLYRFYSMLKVNDTNVASIAPAISAINTLMIKTDIGDVFILNDTPQITKDIPGVLGIGTYNLVSANFTIPDELLEQLRICNGLSWQYRATGETKPVSVPSEGILAMQEFLK
jgi:hypothetical protein